MTALLLTIALFLYWGTIGLAAIAAVRADTRSLGTVLTAPVVGTCLTLLPLFLLSRAGVEIRHSAIPLAVVLGAGAIALLVRLRPPVPWSRLAPVLYVCLAGLCLAGWPLLDFGFRWLGNGNDDMANFVLGGTRLLDASFSAPLDVAGLAGGVDYATVTSLFDVAGARPGASTAIAFVQRLTGLTGYEAFMPLALAFHLCGMCAAGALALQATRRWWAAIVAAGLLAISPLATYSVLQQLIAQVWGLGIACALAALLMRRELHAGLGAARIGDAVLVGAVFSALMLVYPEMVPTIGIAYVAYLGVLALRREIEPRCVLRLWAPAALVVLLALNVFIPREVRFMDGQISQGTASSAAGLPLFGYALTPPILPATVGLDSFAPDLRADLDLSIALAAVLLAGALAIAALGAWRGGAAGIVLVVQAVLAGVLYSKEADFGVFKLTMFVQPFLAAAVAAWVAELRRVRWGWVAAAAAVPLAAVVVSTQRAYVEKSRSPIDVRNASSSAQLPAFRNIVDGAEPQPVVSATDNIVLIKLQAASAAGRRVRFLSQDAFGRYLVRGSVDRDAQRDNARRAVRAYPWRVRAFDMKGPAGPRRATFAEDAAAGSLLRSGGCVLALPSGTQAPFNRRRLPEGSPDLVARPCGSPRNLLVFTRSSLGQHFYGAAERSAASFYQLEPDFFYPGHTLAGLGRYALFRTLGPSSRVRLMVDFTVSLRHDGANRLPPAAAVGATREALPVTGRGSARILSPPLRPQAIAGQSYVMLDMGERGRITPVPREGLERAFGADVPLDPRFLTAYVRDVSLVGEEEIARRRPPSALRTFPADLGNPSLEYAGIYEDGWVGESAFAVMAARPGADLVVSGETRTPEELRVLVNGRQAARRSLPAGRFDVRVPKAAGGARTRVELRFGSAPQLPAPDLRPAAAHLTFLGFAPPDRR